MTPHFRTMVAITLMMIVASAVLIYINAESPGFCPAHPIIGAPACLVVGVLMVVALGSLLIKSRLGDVLFFAATGATFLTSVLLSVREVLGLSRCPRLLEIPLPVCFLVFPTMALLMYLKYRGLRSSRPAEFA